MSRNLESGVIHAMRAFLRVVDSGSFTAAGEQMELTTAQVSRLVADLERRLGAKLLQRTTRSRVLTDIGRDYAARCREILTLVEEAEASAAGATAKPQGRLRLQCMASFGQHYVAPLLADFCAHYPGLNVNYSTSQYFPDLLADGVDVSLYLAESLTDSGLTARRLGTTFSLLCASPDYVRQRGLPVFPADLDGHDCLRVVNPSVSPDWRLTDHQGNSYSFTPQGSLVADTPELLLEMATRGAGVTLLPLFSVIDAIQAGRLIRVLPRWRSPDIGVFALLPSRSFVDAKTRVWLKWIEQHISPRLQADAAYFSPADA
ncbi:HTH lysR-type domain-containing protein [Kerstersia similis]